jgi:hypothetical protein
MRDWAIGMPPVIESAHWGDQDMAMAWIVCEWGCRCESVGLLLGR